MLTTLLALLSSGGVGSLLGLIGGYFNRRLDLEAKKTDQQHDLAKMDKDLLYMKAEYEQKTKVAEIEGATAVDVAGYAAMKESYSYANPTGSGFADSISKAVRPIITLSFFLLTCYIFFTLNQKIAISAMSIDSLEKVYMAVIEWILFQAGISIGWWFANRQSGPSIFGGKK